MGSAGAWGRLLRICWLRVRVALPPWPASQACLPRGRLSSWGLPGEATNGSLAQVCLGGSVSPPSRSRIFLGSDGCWRVCLSPRGLLGLGSLSRLGVSVVLESAVVLGSFRPALCRGICLTLGPDAFGGFNLGAGARRSQVSCSCRLPLLSGPGVGHAPLALLRSCRLPLCLGVILSVQTRTRCSLPRSLLWTLTRSPLSALASFVLRCVAVSGEPCNGPLTSRVQQIGIHLTAMLLQCPSCSAHRSSAHHTASCAEAAYPCRQGCNAIQPSYNAVKRTEGSMAGCPSCSRTGEVCCCKMMALELKHWVWCTRPARGMITW